MIIGASQLQKQWETNVQIEKFVEKPLKMP